MYTPSVDTIQFMLFLTRFSVYQLYHGWLKAFAHGVGLEQLSKKDGIEARH
jgi:hypothetical protein